MAINKRRLNHKPLHRINTRQLKRRLIKTLSVKKLRSTRAGRQGLTDVHQKTIHQHHRSLKKEIAIAGETGEYSEKAYDVKTQDGVTVSEEDIANTRKTLKDAGINEAMFSDLDIAKVIKAASEKSLDVVTVAKDGKF